MLGSLYSGISGLNASSAAMAVIGDNIANVSTTGFKSSSMSFSSMFSQSLGEATANTAGAGVQVASITENWTSGSFENTGNGTDLAISGKGLFVVINDAGEQFYTRAGNFNFNADGDLINPDGLLVQGYAINDGGGLGALSSINIAGDNTYRNQPTSEITIGLNLDSSSNVGETYETTITINDSLGNDIPLTLEFVKIEGLNAWATTSAIPSGTGSASVGVSAAATAAANTVNGVVAALVAPSTAADAADAAYAEYEDMVNDNIATPGTWSSEEIYAAYSVYDAALDASTLTGATLADVQTAAADAAANLDFFTLNFDETGSLTNTTDQDIDLTLTNGAVASQSITLDLVDGTNTSNGNLTGFPSATMMSSQSQDGYPAGILQSVSVDELGYVTGSYSNGQRINLYRLVLADFPSYQGLSKVGNNLYTASRASGQASIAVVGEGRLGGLTASALELSNVDLAAEFVKMITTQRAYQANSRVISTSDELLTELINIKR